MAGLSLFGPDADSADALCSVSELTAQIKALLELGFAEVAVRGEVSGVSRPRSGHVYLNLKDDSAQVRAVMWKADARRLAFDLEDGTAVRAWGRLSVYAPRGEYQVILHAIEPEGVGALELAFCQVFTRLEAEGLFDPGRKRPVPRFPRRIAVVTSPTGAAIHDFARVASRRWPAVEILVAPTRVQGPGAAAEIAGAIALADSVAGVDLIVVARGGGSLEDLWAFNEEAVARAIVAARTPVVSAVGHEVDVTIADCAADLRASTPSVAGELCVPDAAALRQSLDALGERLDRGGASRIAGARAALAALSDRARRALRHGLDRRRDRLARAAASLEALSPLGVLSRGYSLTAPADSPATPVRSASVLYRGALIRTRLGRGAVVSRVESVEVGDDAR